jgi:DNA-directed RNA polymerase subunit H (RpoH/RPB5)
MKNLKFTIAFALFLVIGLTKSNAQTDKSLTDDQKSEMIQQMKMDKEKLALTETQEPIFKEITKKYGVQLKEVKESSEAKRDKFRKLKTIRDEKNAEVKALLSEEQYKTYLTLQEERKEKMKERRKQ